MNSPDNAKVDESDPIIIVTGIAAETETACYELRRRGFLIDSTVTVKGVLNISARMSRKLMIKLAFETDIDVKQTHIFNSSQKQMLAHQAVCLVLRTKKINAKTAWIAHNDTLVKEIANTSGQQRLERINSYYGSKIALYFGWLDFYTQSLRGPAVAGILLFLHQYMIGSIDSIWIPFYCIGICLWGTYFLEYWKRRCSELSFAWEVFECEDHETEKELASAVVKEHSHKLVKQSFSMVVTLSIIAILVKIMLYYKDAQTRAHEIYGADSYSQYIPTVVYSLLPIIATVVFDPIADKLNEYEGHTTQAESENSLIMKKFALQFVNRYCALIYTAFWLKDMEKLKALLISLLTTGALINNALELGMPLVSKLMGGRAKADEAPTAGSGLNSLSAANSASTPYTTLKDKEAAKKAQTFLLNELSLGTYDLKEDYLEMVIQYGYVTMFAVVFPLAGVLAYVNNFFEAKVDSTKLSELRRSPIELRSNIGSWQACLEFVSFVSVLTNCYLMAMVSSQMHVIVPGELHRFLEGENGRFLAMLLIEHILVAIKVVMMSMIDDVPRWVREAVAVEKVESKAAERDRKKFEFDRAAVTAQAHQQMMNAVDNVNNTLGDGMGANHLLGGFSEPGSPMKGVGGSLLSPLNSPPQKGPFGNITGPGDVAGAGKNNATKSLAISRLISESHTSFGFDPINMIVLILLPLALQWLGLSPWLYIPLAVLFFSYLQAQKDRADRKAAIGIVSDPVLMRLIHEELPSWINDSDFHRVEWLNSILKKLWPKVSNAVEDIVFASVQPLLDANTPPVLTCLSLTKFHLGLISPKIIGIRVFDNEESNIRLDIEIRWAGDPNISLKVGTLPLPMMVEVADLRFSATLRVELQNLKSQMPLFKALSITCMKKPFLDFSLKLASMDLMNIGASDFNISALVRNILHNVISDLMVYPAKLIIPMEKEGEEKVVDESQPPVGILTVTFEKGINLKQANIFGSDPYILMKSSILGEEHRTSIKYNTLNPEWNETFDFMIYDKDNQKVDLTVYDYDMTTLEKMLGRAVIETSNLPFNKQTQRTLRLVDTDRGELAISLVYIPIASNKDLAKQMEDEEIKDILFDMAKTDLTNEMIISHETLQNEDDEFNFNDRGSFSDISNTTGFTTMRPGGLQRMKSMQQAGRVGATVEAVGVLNVSQIIVTGLKMPNFTTFRPFVNLSVGSKERKTKYQKGVPNPQYKESFSFIIKDPQTERLLVKVLDKSKWSNHKVLGKVELSVQDVMSCSGGILEQKYMLEGEHQESYVSLKLQWLASATR